MKIIKVTDPRQAGKAYSQYMQYITQVRSGKKAIVMGPEYVVMSMNMYKELTKPPPGFTSDRVVYDELAPYDDTVSNDTYENQEFNTRTADE